MAPLEVQFNPPTVKPGEQQGIIVACTKARDTYQVLKTSTQATVYSARGKWWHATDNDPKEHVTVRYNRRPGGNRVHIYRDGSGNMTPHKPNMRPKGAPKTTEGDSGAYDSVSELSGEEFDKA